MPIRPRIRTTNLPVASIGFQKTLPRGLKLAEADVIWAAITVGHRNPLHFRWYAESQNGFQDILSRLHFVRAYLDFSDPSIIKFTDLFDASDPTEKGFINYRLGMMFMKVAAENFLSTPWCVHYAWMKQNGEATTPTKSSPDLLGYDPSLSEWRSLEAKGRNGSLSNDDLLKAKTQAEQVTHVNNQPVVAHIGGGTYRVGNQLRFKWQDPEPRGKIKLTCPVDAIRNYYAGVFYIYDTWDRFDWKDILGFDFKLSGTLLDLRGILKSDKEVSFQEVSEILKVIQDSSLANREASNPIRERLFTDGTITILE